MAVDVKLCHYDFVCFHTVMNQLSESHSVSLFFLFQSHPPVLVFLHVCSVLSKMAEIVKRFMAPVAGLAKAVNGLSCWFNRLVCGDRFFSALCYSKDRLRHTTVISNASLCEPWREILPLGP